jgi:hypothetical protein
MRRLAGALVAIACSGVVGSGAARADGWYYREGMGTADLEGEVTQTFGEGEIPIALRIAIGRRVGPWSVEGFFAFTELAARAGGGSYAAFSYGVDARYHVAVVDHVELYLRGGVGRIDLGGGATDPASPPGVVEDLSGYGGRGLQYGAGVQVGGEVRALGFLFFPLFFTDIGPKIHAAGWFDTGAQVFRMHDPGRPSLDGKLSAWALGLTLGTHY